MAVQMPIMMAPEGALETRALGAQEIEARGAPMMKNTAASTILLQRNTSSYTS